MKTKTLTLFLILGLLMPGTAQQRPAVQPTAKPADKLYSQSFMDASLEQIVDFYNEWTGRTLIIQTDLSPTITLKFSKLTKDEAMQAIETVLAQNGVAFVPMGEIFLKVVAIATARQEGMAVEPFDPEKKYVAADQLMSQIIPLRYIVFSDVQPIIQQLIHGYGKVISMERINSLLLTDTSVNIARVVEIIEMLDQPLEKIEPRIYQLRYSEAGDMAGKLKELVEAASTPKTKQQQQVAAPRTVPGVIRAPRTTVTSSGGDFADETQMIQGEVKFVSDDRTNILIIFSKAVNFDFFDRIVKVLDVPVDPDVVVETINLEYAEAKEIAGILNEFVGAAKETESAKTSTGDSEGGSKSIDEVVAGRRQQTAPAREISTENKSAIGRLSEDTKILSDERTNSLLLMGSKSDIEALKSVIASLDVMLEQVLIETVILSVGLNDKLQTGVQWLYDTVKGTESFDGKIGETDTTTTSYDGDGIPTETVVSTEDIMGSRTRSLPDQQQVGWDATVFDTAKNMAAGALSYYGVFPSINLSAVVSAAKTDGDTRILSTPVVLTTDNTEAKITIADERPVITSSINSGSSTANYGYSARATYQYKTIGIELTVTPHINPDRFVLMEIQQSADDVGDNVTVDGNEVPVIQKREISATVAVQDRQTIVLGGLVRKSKGDSRTKIPILGDIPLIGWLFSTHNKSDIRSELIILLTPYVLTNPEEASKESERRLNASAVKNNKWPREWSESPLANDEPEKNAWKSKREQKEEKKRLEQEAKEQAKLEKELARLKEEQTEQAESSEPVSDPVPEPLVEQAKPVSESLFKPATEKSDTEEAPAVEEIPAAIVISDQATESAPEPNSTDFESMKNDTIDLYR